MKQTLLIVIFFISQLAFAHEFKSKDFCSDKTTDICGHIGYDKKPDAKTPFEFTADIINKKKAKEITDMVIEVVSKDAKGSDEVTGTTWTIRPDGHHWDAKAKSVTKSEVHSVKVSYKYKNFNENITIQIKE
jgi:hypothetical protein